jgi:hypothetical protein
MQGPSEVSWGYQRPVGLMVCDQCGKEVDEDEMANDHMHAACLEQWCEQQVVEYEKRA